MKIKKSAIKDTFFYLGFIFLIFNLMSFALIQLDKEAENHEKYIKKYLKEVRGIGN